MRIIRLVTPLLFVLVLILQGYSAYERGKDYSELHRKYMALGDKYVRDVGSSTKALKQATATIQDCNSQLESGTKAIKHYLAVTR